MLRFQKTKFPKNLVWFGEEEQILKFGKRIHFLKADFLKSISQVFVICVYFISRPKSNQIGRSYLGTNLCAAKLTRQKWQKQSESETGQRITGKVVFEQVATKTRCHFKKRKVKKIIAFNAFKKSVLIQYLYSSQAMETDGNEMLV